MLPFDDAALAHHRYLLSRIRDGDTEALRELHDLLVGTARRVVHGILADPEDAREAVQDTFIKIWRQASRYQPARGEVVSWLVLIARHTALDRARRGARRRLLIERLAHLPTDPAPAPTEAFDQHELLARPLAELSPPQRRALELAFFAGCTQPEIAAAMAQPVGNVKNHLRRGLLKLRQLVARHD